LIFIKKGGEIRLPEALATNPSQLIISGDRERCQNLIPDKPGDDKNKHGKHEVISSTPKES
jgi:hypothetical protein